MSQNMFRQLAALLPDAPVYVGRVLEHHDDDTSTVELPIALSTVSVGGGLARGALIRPRGRTVPVGGWAFVRRGVIETRAPDPAPEAISVGAPPPPEEVPNMLDTFTGTADTNLIDHDGEVNANWVDGPDGGNRFHARLTGAGTLQFGSANRFITASGNWTPSLDRIYHEIEFSIASILPLTDGVVAQSAAVGVYGWSGAAYAFDVRLLGTGGQVNVPGDPDAAGGTTLNVTRSSLGTASYANPLGVTHESTGTHTLRVEVSADRLSLRVLLDGTEVHADTLVSPLNLFNLGFFFALQTNSPPNAWVVDRVEAGTF